MIISSYGQDLFLCYTLNFSSFYWQNHSIYISSKKKFHKISTYVKLLWKTYHDAILYGIQWKVELKEVESREYAFSRFEVDHRWISHRWATILYSSLWFNKRKFYRNYSDEYRRFSKLLYLINRKHNNE